MTGIVTSVSEAVEATEGLRERKKRATRDALRKAALAATLERGLADATVGEIADAANVSVRTFFNYFSTKQEAVVGFDPDQPARVRATLLARPQEEGPIAALRAVLVQLAHDVSTDRREWGRRLQAIRANPELIAAHLVSWASVEHALVEAIAERTRTDPRDLYPAVVVSAVTGAYRVAMMRWSYGDCDSDLPQLVGEAIDLLASGLHPPAR